MMFTDDRPADTEWCLTYFVCSLWNYGKKIWYGIQYIYIYVTHTSVCRLDLAEFGVLFRAVNISVNIMAWPGSAQPDRIRKVDRLTMYCAVSDTFNTLIKWFWKMKRIYWDIQINKESRKITVRPMVLSFFICCIVNFQWTWSLYFLAMKL